MDFFDHQDRAKASTKWLLVLFLLSVAILVTVISATVAVVLSDYFVTEPIPVEELGTLQGATEGFLGRLRLERVAMVAALIAGVILLASLFRTMQLRSGGGRAIAESLGGRLISGSTPENLHERRLTNVVEEIALASGTPVPEVFILESQDGINAFAAGHSPDDAAIGVTRGAVDRLTRDELQGVIAHEFSHVVHGDMRLNMKLVGMVFGIVFLQQVGLRLMRTARGKDGAPLALIGMAFLVLGALGYFAGVVIKAAVSRQREFLADASAVQYTRNPLGISNALKKIGEVGSEVESKSASEVSHMFFVWKAGRFFSGMLASHPPIRERLSRIGHVVLQDESRMSPQMAAASGGDGAVSFAAPPATMSSEGAVARVGRPTPEAIGQAVAFMGSIPEPLQEAIHEPYGARAAVLCALLSRDGHRQAQKDFLAGVADKGLTQLVERLEKLIHPLGREGRLPVIDLALPALKQLSEDQYRAFLKILEGLVCVDGEIDLFEYLMFKVVQINFDVRYRPRQKPKAARIPTPQAAATVLSALSTEGHANADGAHKAYLSGASALGLKGALAEKAPEWDVARFDAALRHLTVLSGKDKRKLVAACATAAATDGRIEPAEREILRGVSDCLGCPMPAFG